jgi:hypothetical protein
MAARDLLHSIKVLNVIPPVVEGGNTAHVSSVVDTLGYRSVTFFVLAGVLADVDATFVTLLEESDAVAMGDATAVADADLLPAGTAQEAAASFQFDDDNIVKRIGYVGGKRYLRLTISPASNSGSAPIGCVCVLGHPTSSPT